MYAQYVQNGDLLVVLRIHGESRAGLLHNSHFKHLVRAKSFHGRKSTTTNWCRLSAFACMYAQRLVSSNKLAPDVRVLGRL